MSFSLSSLFSTFLVSILSVVSEAWISSSLSCSNRGTTTRLLYSSNGNWNGDSNAWLTSSSTNTSGESDWQEILEQKKDGSFWSSFGSEEEEAENGIQTTSHQRDSQEEEEVDAWLNTLASLSAEEVDFNRKEAERANTARQMEEWGFDKDVIANALDIATDDSLERVDDVDGMQLYREESFLDEVDLETVESHTSVEKDPETNESIRSQMVYVDEHTCIGCTNCAMIAQSTFYMNGEHGRARVFQQWGDDDETIQVAIETCPVNCIHYVPYDELVRLEKDRRGQNINVKARLVSEGEYGSSLSHAVGGAVSFTRPQQISGNMGARCDNCPSRGCRNCPMYGVGKNPEFERKEKLRKMSIAKNRLQQQREQEQKSAQL